LITTSRYIDNTTDDTASEGINEPFPTLSAVFVANPSTEAKYYFKIENSSNYDNSEPDIAIPSYMIELVNLGQ
ncbi:MAG: hypothetical protein GWN87_02845, partial [Desulfuromonadales bacterium]|nr:hypothetical protein [Desulfuromonadales bacterium]